MAKAQFASRTTVRPEDTRADIEHVLSRYGARQFAYGRDDDRGVAVVEFVTNSRRIRLVLPVPDPADQEFTHTPARGQLRAAAEAKRMYDQAVRQRWRALLLIVKAKLEAVASGVMTFENEFLPYTVLPDGRTVADSVQPAIARAYETGEVPALLPSLEA